MNEKLTNAAMYIVVFCALLLTGMTVNREINPKGLERSGVTVKDWRSYGSTGNVVGNTREGLTLVVFSDYECPFCRSLNAKIDSLMVARPQARIVIRQFPLAGHPQAMPAARASVCAAEQHKFWEYHKALFAAAAAGSLGNFAGIASTLQLNEDDFRSCLASNRPDQVIEQDLKAGKNLGVEGTPAMLINEKLYLGLPNDLDALVKRAHIADATAPR